MSERIRWWLVVAAAASVGDRLVGVVAVTKIDCVRAYAILSAAAVSCWFSPSSDWNKWNYAILFCCCCCYIWLCGALDMPRPPTSCCGRLTKVMCIVYYLYIVSFHTALYCCLLWCIFNTDRQIQVLFSVSSGSCGSSKMSYMMHVCSVFFSVCSSVFMHFERERRQKNKTTANSYFDQIKYFEQNWIVELSDRWL